jgi:hypothetical protein
MTTDTLTQEVVRDALAKLAQRGMLSPHAVLDAASDPRHPLHSAFDWDDSEAAAKWRLEQARTLIRSVRVVIETTTSPLRAPLYVRSPQAPSSVAQYQSVVTIKQDELASRMVVESELRAARSHLVRALAIATSLGLQDELRGILDAIKKVRV